MNIIKDLLDKTTTIKNRYDEINKISGNDFNIFKVIDVTSDEVRLHSKFLADLLNPKGSHGQGDTFLKLFLKEVGITKFHSETTNVTVEKYIGIKTDTTGGRIDILLEDKIGNKIIIENKIYARDQENQLLRYYNYYSRNLFYLTLWGNEASEDSSKGLNAGVDYKTISYKYHINNWLSECQNTSKHLPLLREGIRHYINLIKQLTGQTNSLKMNNKIVDLISQNKENIKSAILISNAIIEVKKNIQWQFWNTLQTRLSNCGYELKHSVSKEDISRYYEQSRNNKWYGFSIEIYNKNEIVIDYRVEIGASLYYGFKKGINGSGGDNFDGYECFIKLIEAFDKGYICERKWWWLGWKYPENKLNFNILNSDNVLECSSMDTLEPFVKEFSDEIENDIKEMKDKIKNTL